MNGKPLAEIIQELTNKYPSLEVSEKGHLTVPVESLMLFMRDLKEIYGFNYLTNVTGADYLEYLEVVYNLCIIGHPEMLHVKTRLDRNNPEVPSMVPIWGGAIWQEREVFDLLGIVFTDHPDLRRILLADDWEGHPLRRDYQWEGGRE
ncbi:NADH dehydrogenase subunit C [Desulforamulus reducens MI-1]|uniref:NADH-quinone oxidoreductase n=1 Tax=Desulforamulus reducens (strain ATCC BAA-1160 / DSM 100696 / MI-1) TaxID=349161 RepID=A4J658_DESRM|nr:NADH-quinone oxidoreductase subunit C [Desulforamulus reducens]ABO50561.1 NADH dehydrogenase subunit C [Desulforamulus reducens MI-1]